MIRVFQMTLIKFMEKHDLLRINQFFQIHSSWHACSRLLCHDFSLCRPIVSTLFPLYKNVMEIGIIIVQGSGKKKDRLFGTERSFQLFNHTLLELVSYRDTETCILNY